MGIPLKKIGEVALGAVGVAVGNKTEKRENELLEEILAQQQFTNAILLELMELEFGEERVAKFLEGVEKG